MKLRYEQLSNHLRDSLASSYFVSGDVPLLVEEVHEQLIQKALQAGYSDRITFHVESNFNWNTFFNETQCLSLFSSKRIIDMRFATLKLNEGGSKAIQNYANKPSTDLLLISAPKVDSAQQASAWFKALDKTGIIIQLWPLTLQQWPSWLSQRLQQKKLQVTPRALQHLVDLTEGNLLAAQQAVDKLYLLYGGGSLTEEQVTAAIMDSATFDIFNLVDTCLQGNGKRVLRILKNLLNSGIEPTLILWALTREIRSLLTFLQGLTKGKTLSDLFNSERILEKRKPLIQQALKRYNTVYLYQLLSRIGKIDAVIKGAATGNVEDELTEACLQFAGIPLFR